MQKDFHYYATYFASRIAGYTHDESMEICHSAQLVDCCSRSFLAGLEAPAAAATTQVSMELADARTDLPGLQDITRIWASFHFLPYDLQAEVKNATRLYRNKYRMICRPNGVLVADTVRLAKGRGTEAAGIAMHVLADTWAHSYFAGTPSLVINNTNYFFYELLSDPKEERQVRFRHNPLQADDPEKGIYTNSMYQGSESAIMNLGHGRAGHLPDYSFIRYKYMPAWGDYEVIIKDNPAEYYMAFCQMVYALKVLREETGSFSLNTYAFEDVKPFEAVIHRLLEKRQLNAEEDWKALTCRCFGTEIADFDEKKYQGEYISAGKAEKDDTFLGRFILAALAQKSMVTAKIFQSGNLLAGKSVNYAEKGFRGIRDYQKLINRANKEDEL